MSVRKKVEFGISESTLNLPAEPVPFCPGADANTVQ